MLSKKFEKELDKLQYEAVFYRDGPLAVVAGPGSGKTRVLTHRIVALVDSGVPDYSILALTFTNKAAAEMRDRIESLLQRPHSMIVSTFHSFCLRILRIYAAELGMDSNFTVYDPSDANKVMTKVCAELGHPLENSKNFLYDISWAKNNNITIEQMLRGDERSAEMAKVRELYEKKMLNLNAVDFDDLLLYVQKLLYTNNTVSNHLQQKYSKVLVDEWQDTNLCQYEIVKKLTERSRQLCVVGDQQQAIYGWRGSTYRVLDMFLEDYPEAKTVVLEKNYRSTPQIVEVAQSVVDASRSKIKANFVSVQNHGEAVSCVLCEDSDREASFIANEIRKKSGIRAVIFRTNAQTRPLEKELTRLRVPFSVLGNLRFYERAEVKDVFSYFRLILNPRDELSFQRAMSSPKRGFGNASFEKFKAACLSESLDLRAGLYSTEVLNQIPPKQRSSLGAFSKDLEGVAEAARKSVKDAVLFVLGLGVYGSYTKDLDKVGNLDELVEDASNFDVTRGLLSGQGDLAPLKEYMENVALTSSFDVKENSSVFLITAHASKGREFDHVWLAGMENDLYPHVLSKDADSIEEERRLFFVGITRAKKSLTLTLRERKFQWGEWQDAYPSPFLNDLPESVVHKSLTSYSFKTIHKKTEKTSYPTPEKVYSKLREKSQDTKNSHTIKNLESGLLPYAEPIRLEYDKRVPGIRVEHTVFGEGTILSVDGSEAHICFSDRTRILDLEFAPLKVV